MTLNFELRTLDWRRASLVVAAVLAALVVAGCGGGDDDDDSNTRSNASPTSAGVTGKGSPQSQIGKKINETEVPEELADGTRIGKADAKVTIEMFEDFGCPHCLEFTANLEPMLMKDYVATGKVALDYRFFALRQLTAGAAIAAVCAAEQDKFWPYHRELFIAQAEANEKKGPALTEAFAAGNLRKIAADVGLDTTSYDACLASDRPAALVSGDVRKANELSLPGTPWFVVNGEAMAPPETTGDLRKLLDGLLR